jgi:hypothetical protein
MDEPTHDKLTYPGWPMIITARDRELRVTGGGGARRTGSPEFGGILESRAAGDRKCFVLPVTGAIFDDPLRDDDESV